jgi:hypothetical protein
MPNSKTSGYAARIYGTMARYVSCRERYSQDILKAMSGVGLIVYFRDACCFGHKKNIRTLQGGVYTKLSISPRMVKTGNEEFANKWKPEEYLSFYIRSGRDEREQK